MLTYHARKTARQALFFLLLTTSITSFGYASCSYSISYGLIKGTYTDILGKVDPGLGDLVEKMVNQYSEYCDLQIRIEFQAPFSSRQLVHKKDKGGQHYFKIAYKAPEYSVVIANKLGEIIHQKTYAKEWATTTFPARAKTTSKNDLYKQWHKQRDDFYLYLEEKYNEYDDLKIFLFSLMPAESAVASADSSFAPGVAPSAPQEKEEKENKINFISQLTKITQEEEFPPLGVTSLSFTKNEKNKVKKK